MIIIVECKYCGNEVEKKSSEIKEGRNSFCNASCAAKYNNSVKPKRQKEGEFRECLHCQKEIYITKADMEKTELGIKSVKTNGLYCSNACQQDHEWAKKKELVLKYRDNPAEWIRILNLKTNASQDRIIKQIIIEEFGKGKSGRACWHCGWEEENPFTKKGGRGSNSRFTSNIPTQMNHIDGNPNNQSIENLEIVCPNCHALGPYYGSRGKGGRTNAKGEKKSR